MLIGKIPSNSETKVLVECDFKRHLSVKAHILKYTKHS
jgi:hypothetical protein